MEERFKHQTNLLPVTCLICFNPCFNGRVIKLCPIFDGEANNGVLTLVLLEKQFKP